jgi:S1-C subfamily serine protease
VIIIALILFALVASLLIAFAVRREWLALVGALLVATLIAIFSGQRAGQAISGVLGGNGLHGRPTDGHRAQLGLAPHLQRRVVPAPPLSHATRPVGTPRFLHPAKPGVRRFGVLPPAVVRDEESTVQVRAPACTSIIFGSGFVIGRGLVVTNAHVIAGSRTPVVKIGGSEYPALPVLFDPEHDIAILRVSTLKSPGLELLPNKVKPRTAATLLGYPYGGPLTATVATVVSHDRASTPDIYGTPGSIRDIYEVDGLVRPGNSGGPLVGDDGSVLGVVFAASVGGHTVGFVLTSREVSHSASLVANTGRPVDVGPCIRDNPFNIELSQSSA